MTIATGTIVTPSLSTGSPTTRLIVIVSPAWLRISRVSIALLLLRNALWRSPAASVPAADRQHRRPTDLPIAQCSQCLVGRFQGVGLHGGVYGHLRCQRQEFLAILPGEVRHRAQHALFPEQRVGEGGNVAHVDLGADDAATLPDRAERQGHQLPGGGEEDRRV